MSNELGKLLRKARLDRHLTQIQVGKAVGRTNSFICEMEKGTRGKDCDPVLLVKLAEYLNIPVGVLLEKSDIQYDPESTKFKDYLKLTKNKVKSARIMSGFRELRALLDDIYPVMDGVPGGKRLVEKARETVAEIETTLTM